MQCFKKEITGKRAQSHCTVYILLPVFLTGGYVMYGYLVIILRTCVQLAAGKFITKVPCSLYCNFALLGKLQNSSFYVMFILCMLMLKPFE